MNTTKAKVKIIIEGKEIEVEPGTVLLDAALDNKINLDHNCGGNCACSTCHVIIEEGVENLPEMSEDEEDMLDTAEGLTLESRLGCQVKITGFIKVKIPPKTGI
ncbi:MAG: 2Fe-2S iron-sulfur cluster binding domain-containing protein [FCB group bacterium]|nr:2Fe-2S iron-sulfur cluster binding domain-containing protein [FCB group bacterium]